MSYPSYDQISYTDFNQSYVNGVGEVANPQVGYNWYQSKCSSDMAEMNLVATTPYYTVVQYSFPQNQVSNPSLYYSHEHEPPPTNMSKPYTSDLCAYKTFDTSFEREYVFNDENFDITHSITSPYTLTCHTTLSTGQLYYALESTSPLTTPCSTVASSSALISVISNHEGGEEFRNLNEVVNNLPILVKTEGCRECGDEHNSEGMCGPDEGEGFRGKFSETNYTLEVVKDDNVKENGVKSSVEDIEIDIEDVTGYGSLTDVTGTVISSNKLTNDFDDSFAMVNLLIHQNSSSIMEYVKDFMHVKNRAEFIFKHEFDDNLLTYCFVEGLKEEIREALELWAPLTLPEAINLARFQESLLEEGMAVNIVEMKSDIGLKEFDFQVETRAGTLTNSLTALSSGICRDKNINILADVIDSHQQTTKNVGVVYNLNVMQIIDHPRAVTFAYDLKKGYGIAVRNFDPGGDMVAASLFTFLEGLLELVFNVQVMLRIQADVTARNGHLLWLSFLVLRNFASLVIPPGYNDHENAFCCCHKVMGIDTAVHNKKRSGSIWKGGLDESEHIKRNISEINSSLKQVDKNGDKKWYANGKKNGVTELGLRVNEEFSKWTRVGMISGLEYIVVSARNVRLGTATTTFHHKLQRFILSWVSLKSIGVAGDEHLTFRTPGYGMNHWPSFNGNLDEVIIIVVLEMACSCLAMSKSRRLKWYLELFNNTKKIDVENPIIPGLDALSWKHVLSGYFKCERLSQIILAMRTSYMDSSEASFTSTLSARAYFSSLCASKHCLVFEKLTIYTTSVLFTAACQVLVTTDPFNLFQSLVLKIRYNLEAHNCKCQSKSACILDLLKGVTLDFSDLEIHEHNLKRPFKFMHKRPRIYGQFIHFLGSCIDEKMTTDTNFTRLFHHRNLLSKWKWLFGVLDGFIVNQLPQNVAWGGSLFNTMDHKGTKVSTSTQGEITLSFFAFVILPSCVTSGDIFKLCKNFVLLYAHDDELHAKLAYDIGILALESANDSTRHDGRYNGNDENEIAEKRRGAIQRKRRVSESEKYLGKVYRRLRKEYYLRALAWYWSAITLVFDPGKVATAQCILNLNHP